VVTAMRGHGIAPVLDTLTARWFTDAFAQARPDVIDWRKRQVMDTDPQVFLNVFDIYAETEMAPWLDRVTAPAQIITGENDGGCNPRLNRLIHAALPGSELQLLPDLKHAIFIEATDRVLPHVRRFLTAIDDPARS
jgi:3-oxoadipate enol-lactonase